MRPFSDFLKSITASVNARAAFGRKHISSSSWNCGSFHPLPSNNLANCSGKRTPSRRNSHVFSNFAFFSLEFLNDANKDSFVVPYIFHFGGNFEVEVESL